MRILKVIAPVALWMLASPAFAQNAPKQLYNKSITLSFGLAELLRAPDGRTINPSPQRELVVYVSSAGRIFQRSTGHGRGGGGAAIADTRQRGPGDAGDAARQLRFQGNQLIGAVKLTSGANLVVATFDPGFTSCTLAVQFGKEGGKNIRLKGIDGVDYEVLSISAVHPSCSIKDGNAFAN